MPTFSAAGANDPQFITLGGDATEGAFVATLFDRETDAAKEFIAAYKAEFGEEPTEAAAWAYDAASMIFAALDAGAEDRESIIAKASELGRFDLPLHGPLVLSDTQGVELQDGYTLSQILVVKDGQFTSYQG